MFSFSELAFSSIGGLLIGQKKRLKLVILYRNIILIDVLEFLNVFVVRSGTAGHSHHSSTFFDHYVIISIFVIDMLISS